MSSSLPLDCKQCLERIATQLVSDQKGILALDTLISRVETNLQKICIEMSRENLRMYRQLFLTTNTIYLRGISGVLLDEDGVTQKTDDNEKYYDFLKKRKLLMGVSCNIGTHIIDENLPETVPLLDIQNLQTRCAKYSAFHNSFAVMEVCISFGKPLPTVGALRKNAYVFGLFAATCQQNFLVPILVVTGKKERSYEIEYCRDMLKKFFGELFYAFCVHNVYREGLLIALTPVTGGKTSNMNYTAKEIAVTTVEMLLQSVVPAVPGIIIMFEDECFEKCLDILNEIKLRVALPWHITYIFGPVFQKSVLYTWYEKSKDIKMAQAKFLENLRACLWAGKALYNEAYNPFIDT